MDYKTILQEIYEETQKYRGLGNPVSYIPELAKVDPDQYGIYLQTLEGEGIGIGDYQIPFSIQSISKVFTLAMGFSILKETLWERIGVEPSGNPFNSIMQLEIEKGIPRNPLINAGALVLSDILISHLDHPLEEYLAFVRLLSKCPTIEYDEDIAQSERKQGFLNAAIANMLKHYGNIENDIDEVLSFYFHQCAVTMDCKQLTQAFIPFANHKEPFSFGSVNLTDSQVKRINAIMLTCGFYDESGEFSYLVGLPGKSGVGGGISALFPQEYAVTVWSPRLNEKGNSSLGVKALELLTTKTKHSIF